MDANVAVFSFTQLFNACRDRGMKARLYLFDDGQTVEVSSLPGGEQLLRVTATWGDHYTATDLAAKTLMDKGLLTVFDLAGTADARTDPR